MSGKTKIQWTDSVWNCIAGCSKVSAGCQNCYAETMAYRLACMGQEKYIVSTKIQGGWSGQIVCDESALEIPLHWKKPRRIFINSMSDTFHEKVPFEFIDKIFAVMALCPQHTFQVLTKRPDRMAEYFGGNALQGLSRHSKVIEFLNTGFVWVLPKRTLQRAWNNAPKDRWPLSNVWLGVTCENQEMADKQIPILLQIPAMVRFISAEPLLGEIELQEEKRRYLWNNGTSEVINWLVIGCESGSHRRPMKLEWVKTLVEQADSAGIPVFVKQLDINGKVEKDINRFPKEFQRREWPARK